MNEG
jgi:hypothetical protein